MMNQKFVLVVFILAIVGCKDNKSVVTDQVEAVEVTENFNFLIGDWKRTNDDEGKITYEHWNKKAQFYGGTGYTMQGADTIWQEEMILFENMQDWYLSITGTHDTTSTNFLVTEIKDGYFKCQNPDNEFPKVIEYSAGDNQLNAAVSAGKDTISFSFMPID